MNVNEILSIRANELLRNKNFSVHPNNDINMSQSSNDVVTTAAIIQTYKRIDILIDKIDKVIISFSKLKKRYGSVIKVGRKHMEDAVPVTFEKVLDPINLLKSSSINMVLKREIQNNFNYINFVKDL